MPELPLEFVEEARIVTGSIEGPGEIARPEIHGLARGLIALQEYDEEVAVEVKEAFRLAEALGNEQLRDAGERLAAGEVEAARSTFRDVWAGMSSHNTQREAVAALAHVKM